MPELGSQFPVKIIYLIRSWKKCVAQSMTFIGKAGQVDAPGQCENVSKIPSVEKAK